MKREFSRQFSKNTQISSFMKIRPVGAELFHKDRQRTDMMKLAVAFRNLRTPLKSGCKLEALTSIRRQVTTGFCAVGELSLPDFCKTEAPVSPRRANAELPDLSDSHSFTLLLGPK
jgi:hypothetical protein